MDLIYSRKKRVNWRYFLQLIGSVLIFFGLFGPWIWQGYNPTSTFNPLTKKMEVQYARIVEVSPLYTRILDAGLSEIYWFYEFNLSITISLSAFGFIFGIFFCSFRYGINKYFVVGVGLFIVSVILFSLSFGRGLSIRYKTFYGWGLQVTAVGGTILFTAVILDQFQLIQ